MFSRLLNADHLYGSALTSLVVGSVLCVTNHSYRWDNVGGIALNYAVPFLVSMYAKVSARAAA